MTDLERSATAYTTLAEHTERYIALQALDHDWLVMKRAADKLCHDLHEHNRLFPEIQEALMGVTAIANEERRKIGEHLNLVGNDMALLNEQIQNGVYNE